MSAKPFFKAHLLLKIAVLAVLLTMIAGAVVHAGEPTTTEVEHLVPEVISTRPHNPNAYTQGLVLYEGYLYESTGRDSSIRKVDPETGEVLQEVDLRSEFFGEGLARIENRLYQITWKNQIAIVYDLETFEPLKVFPYEGEGWGLCYDDEYLYMTDGSEFIYIRDPETFDVVDFRRVLLDGEPVTKLNELECVGDEIYSNVYQTDTILRIDKASGAVTAVINAFDLLSQEDRDRILGNDSGAVLNGIAYDADNDVFLITGKLWDKLFEVRFVPEE